MTTRYRIHHRSAYRYDSPVTASFNEARLTPVSALWQHPMDALLHVEPATWQYTYTDYWGTQVRVFEAHDPHRELVVDAVSLVEVNGAARPVPDVTLQWTDLRADSVQSTWYEYLAQLPTTEPPPDLADRAETLAANLAPHDAAHAISAEVHDAMTYEPGSTGVYTLAGEAWAERRGVCQDYAHLVVGALRHVGVPARYVSGYVHPSIDAQIGEPAVGESHAWVEWWLGEWTGHDPTNAADVLERHVVVGTGRDYGDVPPIKGIVAGTPVATELAVEVEITRMA